MVLVSLLILAPGQNLPETDSLIGFDKIAHTLVFSIEILLIIVGFNKQNELNIIRKNPILWAMIICLVHNFVLEFSQLAIPGREFDVTDMLANFTGLIVGTTIFWIIYKF